MQGLESKVSFNNKEQDSHKILDCHAHLRPDDGAVEKLLSTMKSLGIDETWVLAGGVASPDKLALQMKTPPGKEQGKSSTWENDTLLKQVSSYPQLKPFFFANPWQHVSTYQQQGHKFWGLKLGPVVFGGPFQSEEVKALVSHAEKLMHPVYAHCLDTEGFKVKNYVSLAKDFPHVNFILGHGGIGPLDFGAIDAIKEHENIFLETSGTFLQMVKVAIKKLGAERVLFGSEYPLQSPASELAKIKDAIQDLDFQAWNKITFSNSVKLMAPQMAVAAARQSSFYEERLKNWSGQWENIPFTTKHNLRQQYPEGLRVPGIPVASYHESSGTTGEPTATYFSQEDWDVIVKSFLGSGIALNKKDWVFIKTPYSLATTAHQMQKAAEYVGATVVPADNRCYSMTYPKVIKLVACC